MACTSSWELLIFLSEDPFEATFKNDQGLWTESHKPFVKMLAGLQEHNQSLSQTGKIPVTHPT